MVTVTAKRHAKASRRLSLWIEDTVRLPVGLSAEPGPIKLAPYMREIADAIGDPRVERITLQKATRIGWTTLMGAAVGHFMIRDPARVMVLWPTESDARNWVIELESILDGSPALADALPVPHPGKRDRNSLLYRIADNGAALIVAGAGAPRRLRHHSVRVLMIDELDGVEQHAEGDVVGLATQRTISFGDRKILCGSTPLEEATSHICRLYGQSDQRVFECPCPECSVHTEVLWRHIEWPEGEPERAAFRCPNCSALVAEKHKPWMVRRGRWRAQRPEAGPGHRGYRLNALVSPLPNVTWPKLAAEFLSVKDNTDQLKVFTTCTLAEPWRSEGDELDDAALAARAEAFGLEAVPPEVLAVTVGADLQDDRIEATIAGHGKDGTVLVLGHEVFFGRPAVADDPVWADLDGLLRRRFVHPLGGLIGIDAAAVDGGDGDHLSAVLAFCRPRHSRRILCIKGMFGMARRPLERAKTKAGTLFLVGVDAIKARIFASLERGRGIRFSNTLAPEFYEQLASERRVVRMRFGKPIIRFERVSGRARAEALDALTYALAAKAALGLSAAAFVEREEALRSRAPKETPPPVVIKSKWMERGRERW